MFQRVERWLDKGPFTPRDLAIYRIVYASIALLTLHQFDWLATLPGSFFVPPPGPFALADGFPSAPVLAAMEILVAVALVSLLIGFATRTSSIVVFVLSVAGEGFGFSTGKIDHTILMAIVPLLMAFSRWGDAISVDVLLRPEIRNRPVRQWVMRLLAVSIGAAMMTAGLPKLYNGWLSLTTQASFGYQGLEFYSHERQAGLAEFLVALDAPWFWEVLDWGTVILECGLLFAALTWRSWRIGLALFTMFHMGVLLALNIAFWQNIVAYAAFVAWGALLPARQRTRAFAPGRARLVAAAVAVSVLGGLSVWWIGSLLGQGRLAVIAPIIVSVGFVFGVVYLLREAWRLVARMRAGAARQAPPAA